MGQHRYNPTAIIAKENKITPKQHPMGSREFELLLCRKANEVMIKSIFSKCSKQN